VVIVSAGFSERMIADEEPGLTIIVDQNTQAGHMTINAIQAAVMRLLGTVRIAQLSVQAFEAGGSLEGEAARQAYVDEALAMANEAWRQPPLTVAIEQAGRATEDEEQESPNPFTQSSPGMIVQFVVFGLITSATVLVLERKSRALQRLLTTPITRVEVIGGHVLAMFIVVFLQQAVLVAVGQLAFGVDYMREPLGTLLMMVALAFWTASLGLLIGAIAQVEDQVVAWSLIAMFVFSALGGAWFPLELTGKTFSAIGHLMPTAWAMDGFQNIVMRGLGLNSVLVPAGILLACAAVFFGLAVWRFKFE
jgi:ABC-2 type transport system permease protein